MKKVAPTRPSANALANLASMLGARDPRHVVIGFILLIALFAFELFNFDTTRYALNSLLGNITFLGLGWSTILAVAFCAIDFAGLARLFTPQKGVANEPKEVWFLMGAWLLGATMNAVMTWWAVSLTLLNHQLGNEILDREQLLQIVPIFVALLVWLTRILFIGSLTVAGETMFDFQGESAENQLQVKPQPAAPKPQALPVASTAQPVTARPNNNTRPAAPVPATNRVNTPRPAASFSAPTEMAPPPAPKFEPPARPNVTVAPPPATGTVDNRNRRRPPVPNNRPAGMPLGMQASDHNKVS